MMMSEFTERTKYEPSFEEYAEIEESYYEFDGNKDDFCKAWLKDKKSGAWEKEYNLRKRIRTQNEMINEMRSEGEASDTEKKNLYEERWQLLNKIEELTCRIEKAEKEVEWLKDMQDPEIKITLQDDEAIEKRAKEIRYINNNGFMFFNVTEKSGWIDSYKLEDIKRIKIC